MRGLLGEAAAIAPHGRRLLAYLIDGVVILAPVVLAVTGGILLRLRDDRRRSGSDAVKVPDISLVGFEGGASVAGSRAGERRPDLSAGVRRCGGPTAWRAPGEP